MQFPNLTLKVFNPGLLLNDGTVAGNGIAFRLTSPAPQAIWSTAKFGRDRLISSVVTAISRAFFIEKPNAARAELSRIRRGMFALCHKGHSWRFLLSSKPGAVRCAGLLQSRGPCIEVNVSLPVERVVRSLNQIIEWRRKPQSIRIDNGP